MESIAPGSRGAPCLHVHGSRSPDDAGTVLVSSQQWSFPSRKATYDPSLSASQINTHAGPSTRVQLTPATIPPSLHDLGLYPRNEAEAGSSIDADIIAAQRLLRQNHTDLEIPYIVLANAIYDKAAALEDSANELDGSRGLADGHAIAVLGPVTLEHKSVYAVICIGGRNRDCLLLHHLESQPADGQASGKSTAGQTATTPAKGKAKETDASKTIFIPAFDVERRYQTPVLQIVASHCGKYLAVRTHTSTSFLALKQDGREDCPPWLRLETIYHVQYGVDDYAQHHDVCFSQSSSTLAAAVDRIGNIHLFRLRSSEEPPLRQPDAPPASPGPNSSAGTSPASGPAPAARRSFAPASIASTSIEIQPSSSVTVESISANLLLSTVTEPEQAASVTTEPNVTGRSRQQTSGHAPFRIIFGSSDRKLFLLTRHALIHVELEDHGAVPNTNSTAKVSTILQSSFSLTSFRRARFFSIASTEAHPAHRLLAVCSSDSIHWIDLDRPSEQLFPTAHHRGDDPTLMLTRLPAPRGSWAGSPGRESTLSLWALSSRRNSMVSCYTVESSRHKGSGQDMVTTQPGVNSASGSCTYALNEAPILLPVVASASRLQRPAAPLLFFDATQLLHREQNLDSWIVFEITDRGILFAQILEGNLVTPFDVPTPTRHRLELEVAQPTLDTELYIDDSDTLLAASGQVDASSDVRTRILDFQKLHRTLFSTADRASAGTKSLSFADGIGNRLPHLLDSSSIPSKSNASVHAATLSLGELWRKFLKSAGHDSEDGEEEKRVHGGSWSTALELEGGKQNQADSTKAILDLRSDVRHALSSLGISPASGTWSRAAAASHHHSDGATNRNGRSSSPTRIHNDVLERALTWGKDQIDVAPYLPRKGAVQPWSADARGRIQASLRDASQRMMLDLALESEIFLRPKARILDEGAPMQRPQHRRGTNWTAFEHRDIYNFVEEQGDTIPPPHVGSVGLSFFAPLRTGDVEGAARSTDGQNGPKKGLDAPELEALLPSTSSTARLLLAEWQLGEDPAEYTYLDPFEGLHRLPRASRMRGPTARARSRSFSRASSASTEDRSRSRSRSRKQSAAPSLSQSDAFASQGPPSSYPPSLVSQGQSAAASGAPPTLVSRRKCPHNAVISRSQPLGAATQDLDGRRSGAKLAPKASSMAQSQPATHRFGFAGSFGDLTPTVSPASSQAGTPTQRQFGASTQIEAGRFGARPTKPDRPPKKKKRASGF